MRFLLCALILSISVNVFAKEIPCYDFVSQVHSVPYNKTSENCLDKSLRVHNHFVRQGIESQLVVGRCIYFTGVRHAWVIVKYNNKWIVIDATDKSSTWGWETKHYYWLIPQDYYIGILRKEQIK